MFGRVYKNNAKYSVLVMLALVTLVLVMLALVMHKFFFMHCLVWCIKNSMHCIKIFIYKSILHNYGGKDVKVLLRGNWVFNYINACIKSFALLIPRNPWY